jgi:hypothetical protein
MPQFDANSQRHFQTLCPELQEILFEAIQKVKFRILEGHRNEAAQNRAFDEGRSKLRWPKGNHNKFPSDAVDVIPESSQIGDTYSWKDVVAFGRLMGYLQAIADRKEIKLRFGLDWDGDWRTVGQDPDEKFLDAPHVEVVR